ncbi:MAG: 50S ribosomal protein L35 [Clostridia bacterium]|nr:50S ribosomal protein L35 [Clostridia bacterium]
MGKIKQKTHKATAKKFKIRNSGSVKYKRQGANHNTVGYSSKRMRKLRKAHGISSADNRRLKRLLDRMN